MRNSIRYNIILPPLLFSSPPPFPQASSNPETKKVQERSRLKGWKGGGRRSALSRGEGKGANTFKTIINPAGMGWH